MYSVCDMADGWSVVTRPTDKVQSPAIEQSEITDNKTSANKDDLVRSLETYDCPPGCRGSS